MFFDAKWDAHGHSLKGNGNLVRVVMVRHNICADEFWAQCKNIMTMAKPLFIVVWIFDGNQLVMGIAYTTMLEVKTCFKQMKDHLTTKIFGFCNCCLQLKFSCMRHMQLQICVVA
jgi:hypothetical protein